MKLNSSSLNSHLSRELLSVYLVSGDEPLLVQEAVDSIREAARNQGFTERESWVAERGFDWQQLAASSQNLSLFGGRKLLELRLPTGRPGDAGGKVLSALAAESSPDTLLVVTTPRLDSSVAKSRWVKNLEAAGARVAIQIPTGRDLIRWLSRRLADAGLHCDAEVAEYLAGRLEGNLVAASQEIEKLVLLSDGGDLSLDQVRDWVTDGSRYDVFQLADAAVDGDSGRTVRVLNGLRAEGVAPALVSWALMRELVRLADLAASHAAGEPMARAMTRAGVWRGRQDIMTRRVKGLRKGEATALLKRAADTDRVVKGAAFGDSWSALLRLALAISGRALPSGVRP